MRSLRNRWATMVVLALVLASGCMSFRQGGTKVSGTWPMPSPAVRQRVSLVLRHEVVLGGKPTEPNPVGTEQIRQIVMRAYQDANIFGSVRPGMAAGGNEFQVDITVVNEGTPNIGLAILSGLTLTLIPAVATDGFVMRTAVRGADGSVLAEVEHRDALRTWIQLFLIFGTFAASPNAVAESILYDMARASIQDLDARGAWSPRQPQQGP